MKTDIKKSTLYTRTGDSGTTSLVGGQRADKDDPRLKAYGTVDELNSHLGLVCARATDPDLIETLRWIQHRLFDLGAYLACPPDGSFTLPPGISEADIARLEKTIDMIDSRLPKLNRFVLPGGTVAAAEAHVARTVARRAERRIITLNRLCPIDPIAIRFINRLSDFLFAVARFNNVNSGVDEIFWQKDC